MAFKDRLRAVIADLGISQAAFAERIDVTPQSVWNWATGISMPRSDILDRLPAATGRPLYWFFMTDEEETDCLSSEETRMLHLYSSLLPGQRAMLIALMEGSLTELNQWATKHKA